jgi:hypothetical protein
MTKVIWAWSLALGMAVATLAQVGAQQPASDGPSLTADGTAAFPSNYREWMFLSAGLGMNYGPNAPAAGQPQSFTNVYVNPSSYRTFMKTGAWPDRTMFVLEIRGSASEGSINRAGHFQTDLKAIEANIKDTRLPGGWGFYNFGAKTDAVAPLPQTASCYTCHTDNTAVEHTFVQFYPSLMDVARKMGTVKPSYKEGTPIR